MLFLRYLVASRWFAAAIWLILLSGFMGGCWIYAVLTDMRQNVPASATRPDEREQREAVQQRGRKHIRVSAIFIACGWIPMAVTAVCAWRRARFVRSASVCPGDVLKTWCRIARTKTGDTAERFFLQYAFTGPEGLRREGEAGPLTRGRILALGAGDGIGICYDAPNPDRHEADIFQVRMPFAYASDRGPGGIAPGPT